MSKTIRIEDGVATIPRPEPLGFIGNDYYRFYIHYNSAKKTDKNPYKYVVYGKTRVKDDIHTFHGTLLITEAKLYSETDVPGFRQGFVSGTYRYYESRKKRGAGRLSGTFKSYFLLDSQNKLRYDALMLVSDGFSNNEFIGSRTLYSSGESEKCNWGDFRIPESKNLDSGAGEFLPDEKYRGSGWETYWRAVNSHNNPTAQEIEMKNSQWWKRKAL